MSSAALLPYPAALQAPGTDGAPFQAGVALDELPPGSLRRLTFGDLDVLIAHTNSGIVATDDRCPHMSAPFTAGRLDGCTLYCPLHSGAFDICEGEVVAFPTTGGLTADGEARPAWVAEGAAPKPPQAGAKVQARALTRVRRLRYYPLRICDGVVEIALPA